MVFSPFELFLEVRERHFKPVGRRGGRPLALSTWFRTWRRAGISSVLTGAGLMAALHARIAARASRTCSAQTFEDLSGGPRGVMDEFGGV